MVLIMTAILVCCALILPITAGAADKKPEYTINFGVCWPKLAEQVGFQMFIDKIESYSEGRIKINYFPNNQLGTHDEHFQGCRDGSIELVLICPYDHLVPGSIFTDMPYVCTTFDGHEIVWAPKTGVLWKLMDDACADVGIKMLWASSQGPWGFANRVREVRTADDLKGMKVRAGSTVGFLAAVQEFGAGRGVTFETIPWSDLYNALSKGVIDGAWTNPTMMMDERHVEATSYYSDIDFAWQLNIIAANQKFWEELPPELQDAIMRASEEVSVFLNRHLEKHLDSAYAEIAKFPSMKVTRLTQSEKDAFRELANPREIWISKSTAYFEKRYPGQNKLQEVIDELERVDAELRKEGKSL